MRSFAIRFLPLLSLCACAAPWDPLENYDDLAATTILDAPAPQPGSYAPASRGQVERGEYLVELLGCGACHTDGALTGSPNSERPLAGSRTGIAYTNPLEHRYPGVVYPSNITPDTRTGIGDRSDREITEAIRAGIGRHGGRRIVVMPWQGYARLSDEDSAAIVAYLRSITPMEYRVPDAVPPGTQAPAPYVHFGVYRAR
jgi:mono/diheme cytochrome c family protein